jgi:hypothetical protein
MKTLYDLKVEEAEKEVNKVYSSSEQNEIYKVQRRRHLKRLFRKNKGD